MSFDKDVLLHIDGVSLDFGLPLQRSSTMREGFARFLSHPLASLRQQKQQIKILENINIKISRGDRVALIGKNGAGKTSLCRCIMGLYQPQVGQVFVPKSVRSISDIGLTLQQELTGRENAWLLANFLYPESSNIAEIVAEALEFSELGAFVDAPIKKYSTGMQTRLWLSVYSSQPCDLLILDEVFDGADVFFQQKVSARIMQLIERSGAVLFVSHSLDQIRRVCNRVLLLDGHRIAYDGPASLGIDTYLQVNPRQSFLSI